MILSLHLSGPALSLIHIRHNENKGRVIAFTVPHTEGEYLNIIYVALYILILVVFCSGAAVYLLIISRSGRNITLTNVIAFMDLLTR